MSKSSKLYNLMSKKLPSLSYQKKLGYRTSHREVLRLFHIINQEIFNDKLPTPKIQIMSNCREYWGYCESKNNVPDLYSDRSNCIIRVSDKWFCKQWLVTTLAHEMCHQYQWDIESKKRVRLGKRPLMSHGPSFFKFKSKLAKHGIPLKTSHRIRLWFEHQKLFRC